MEKLLQKLNIGRIYSCKRVKGGRDSIVYRVEGYSGKVFAVRILPEERIKQFKQEEQLIAIAMKKGIPVPVVHEVRLVGKHAVMIMDWGRGRTVLEELRVCPENVLELGQNFGRMQRRLHKVMPCSSGKSQWLHPKTEKEREIFDKAISVNKQKVCFLHMDYHPLNILTENNEITAVLDWVNASQGDYRYDLARTYSILNMEEARRFLGLERELLHDFTNAWLNGYYRNGQEREGLEPYLKWAHLRLTSELTEL